MPLAAFDRKDEDAVGAVTVILGPAVASTRPMASTLSLPLPLSLPSSISLSDRLSLCQ